MSTVLRGETAATRRGRGRGVAPAVVLGVLGALVAAVGSWHVSLWYDESATVSASTRSFGNLVALARRTNAAQAVYYGLEHLWIDVVGASPAALRASSALAVGVATVGVVLLARTALRPGPALLAGVVFAVLPRVTWAGIEARPYALTAAVAVWATWCAVQAARTRRPGWWVGYAVLAGVGTALYVYLALLVVAHGLVLLLARATPWRVRLGWLVAAVVAAALASPVLVVASGQTDQLGIASTLSPATLVRQLVVTEWFLGDTPTPVSAGLQALSDDPTRWLWSGCAVALAVLGWCLALLALRRPWSDADGAPDLRWWLVAWIALPAAVIGLYSVLVAPMYVPRYLTFATPALAVLIAQGATVVLPAVRWVRVTAAVVAVVLVVPVYASQRTAFAKNSTDWSAVADWIGTHHRAGQAVYFGPLHGAGSRGDGAATLRQVQVCYPDDFRGLVDLTLVRSASASDSLVATSRPLAASADRLAGVDTVWVLRRRDTSSAEAAAEDAVLQRAGFVRHTSWLGPSDEVLRFDRG